MAWQSLVDIIGKLGTLLVAVAVFANSRSQGRWSNEVTRRAALVEDQKFRLALLDRRSGAIEHVQRSISQFWVEGSFQADGAAAATDALRIAEYVFDDSERGAIEQLVRKIWEWQSTERRRLRYARSSDVVGSEKFEKALDDQQRVEEELISTFEPLLSRLKDATRVKSVEPLMLPRRRWLWRTSAVS